MNNSNREDFERMVQLAEFGARRHDERRQIEFRVFISYNTLLVLIFYYLEKIAGLNTPWWANILGNLFGSKPLLADSSALWGLVIGLLLIHFFYLLWQIRLSRALVNDAWRRNFYLKKAECILQHLWKQPNLPFRPGKKIYVTIAPGGEGDKKSKCSRKKKVSECELFEKHEPDVILVSSMLVFWKHWDQMWTDWSRPFQILVPTVILNLLIIKLAGGWWALSVTVILIILVALLRRIDIVLSKRGRSSPKGTL